MADPDQLDQRMEERWREYMDAERAKRPQHELIPLYDAYLGALDDYVRRKRDLDAEAARKAASGVE